MADEEFQIVTLRDDFYRDSFGKLISIIIGLIIAIMLLIGLCGYFIYLDKPRPVHFQVGNEWRVVPPVALDQPYLSTPDLLQWISSTLPKAFVYDFNHYNEQLEKVHPYFTEDGWKIFLNQLNIYVNYNTVQTNRLFVNGTVTGAPYILRQGLLSGKYGWWIQVPIKINFAGYAPRPSQTLTLQLLVVRVPTLNNLQGVAIDNVIVAEGASKKPT